MTNKNSQRSSTAAAYRWANQVTSLGFELAVPIAGGVWLDRHYGLTPWLTICGVLLGSLCGLVGLIKLIRDLDK